MRRTWTTRIRPAGVPMQFCPAPAGDVLTGSQVEELTGTLDVASWTKTDGSNCASCLSIGWAGLLVRLDAASKLELAALVAIELDAGHDVARTQSGGRAAFGRTKCVDPQGR